jgi:hypothetical protein
MKFFLSVNKDGVVSLWDHLESAMACQEGGEQAVTLILTPEQAERIKAAKRIAQEKSK